MDILEKGLGLGVFSRIKNTIESRGKNVQGSFNSTRDTVVKAKPWAPGSIISNHVQGTRAANREMAPGLKDL